MFSVETEGPTYTVEGLEYLSPPGYVKEVERKCF